MNSFVFFQRLFAALVAIAFFLVSENVSAEDITFYAYKNSGNGCPEFSYPTVEISRQEIFIHYPELRLTYGPFVREINCSFRFPFQVKAGYRLVLESIEMKGYSAIPANTRLSLYSLASFNSDPMFVTDRIQVLEKGTGPSDEKEIHRIKQADKAIVSECGVKGVKGSLELSSTVAFQDTVFEDKQKPELLGRIVSLRTKFSIIPCN